MGFLLKNPFIVLFWWFKAICKVDFNAKSSKSKFREKKCEHIIFLTNKARNESNTFFCVILCDFWYYFGDLGVIPWVNFKVKYDFNML